MKPLKHAAFFNGIGGFQLAARWMGWINVFSSEIDPFCNKITKHHFPNCIQYEDIKTTDFNRYRGQIDIATGGFPCQPFSTAGKRNGAEDDRYLWPPFLRAIDQVRPRWAVLENVVGITSMVQSQIERFKVEEQKNIFSPENDKIITELREFVVETICNDLEQIGYTVAPVIIPACAVGAPHKRERIWFIAFNSDRSEIITDTQSKQSKRIEFGRQPKVSKQKQRKFRRSHSEDVVTRQKQPKATTLQFAAQNSQTEYDWQNFPTESPICGGNDGLPEQLDGITFSSWRNESIKAYGNAIVPQTAYEIFKAIEQSYDDQ